MIDVVIDTNVMLHADNSRESRRPAAVRLLQTLVGCSTFVCVDVGFSTEIARNQSLIGGEYLKHLKPGSLGFHVVARLASEGRIRQVPRRPERSIARRINQVLRNRRDRTFLSVAYSSEEKILVSHDFTDFQIPKRRRILKEIGVRVIEAIDCEP